MLPKYLFYIAFGTLILSGCGLETDDDEDDSSVTTVVMEGEQNEYLPLTNATSFFYTPDGGSDGDVEGQITYDVGTSNTKGYAVYKMTLEGTDLNTDLYLRSTSSQILLLGVDGPISAGNGNTLDRLRFNPAIKLIGNLSDQTSTATVSGEYQGRDLDNTELAVTYDLINSNEEFDSVAGSMPILNANVSATLTIPILDESLTVALDFSFTKGLGMVQHSGNYTEGTTADYDIGFDHLDNLLNIIWFNQSGSEANGSIPVFSLSDNGTPIRLSSSEYDIANQSALDAYTWLTITENTVTENFAVSVDTTDASYPDTLTSVQVLFENRQDGERLSASVIVLED